MDLNRIPGMKELRTFPGWKWALAGIVFAFLLLAFAFLLMITCGISDPNMPIRECFQ